MGADNVLGRDKQGLELWSTPASLIIPQVPYPNTNGAAQLQTELPPRNTQAAAGKVCLAVHNKGLS